MVFYKISFTRNLRLNLPFVELYYTVLRSTKSQLILSHNKILFHTDTSNN